MTSRTFVLTAFVSALLVPDPKASAQTHAPLPIAYVSVQRILNEADGSKAAAKELEALREKRAQELNAKKRALDETKLQLANAGGMFSSSKRQQLADLAKHQESELQQATQQAQTELLDRQKKVQQELAAEVNKIVTALAQQRGVQYVLNQDIAVLLGPPGANWTAEVLQRLNAQTAPHESAPEKAPANKPAPKTP